MSETDQTAIFEIVPDTRHGHLGEKRIQVTPYAGTSGWSGSDTSRERAEQADKDGTTSARQAAVLAALEVAGARGLTWAELASDFGWHHGTASGALSVLHKDGQIARLQERRGRMKIYTALRHINGRTTEAHGRTKPTTVHTCSNCGHQEALA